MVVAESERTTLGLTVKPDQSVILRIPVRIAEDEILRFLSRKEEWIYRQLLHFEAYQPATPTRKFIGGETHLFLGRAYRLRIMESPTWKISRATYYITIGCPFPSNPDKVREHYLAWQKEQAMEVFTELHLRLQREYEQKLGYWLPCPGVRYYQNRWGTYLPDPGVYLLNARLVQAPIAAIEYVILHEICHHKYPGHDRRFIRLLSSLIPDWEKRKSELERVMA
ncbi:MAG: SprT family zinc-dependent metalloprotease [Candidatus Methanomethylophilaceae archaeon]|jgi:hypothetical protein|nr:SprT family zinc-dependent metalloprotease [Candidatus Methanomethylophilaceae archaeon]